MERHVLRVGQKLDLKTGWLSASQEFVFAGMPSAETFSIAVHGDYGDSAWGYNLYFGKTTREIRMDEKNAFRVVEISPVKIVLEKIA